MIKEYLNKLFNNKIMKLHIGCGTLYKDGWIMNKSLESVHSKNYATLIIE